MSRMQQLRNVAQQAASGNVGEAVRGMAQDAGGQLAEGIGLDPHDFIAAKDQGASTGTKIVAKTSSLGNAGEVLNRSSYEGGPTGPVHVITPMVLPRGQRVSKMFPAIFLTVVGIVGFFVLQPFDASMAVFGPHYWILTVLLAVFLWWRAGMVMVPEGCQALISKFGRVENQVGPGLVTLLNPWKKVQYIVNTTREYPFNAPIREAPTKSGVQASVDLFLQFRIINPREFIFVLGAVQGFQDKLNNAISEMTRSLIYEQEASGIYDLVGENTTKLLDQLNQQFAGAVELTTANITHAEPSSQEYRMDLAAPEMVRVAKEAYTYEYELQLRKEQNEGDLNKDLASLNEQLSAIQADIARYQAQMDTALERETNRARAVARQRFVEAESSANANAALLEAQALDIRALSASMAPEILDYRYQQDMLTKLESVAGSLPQIVSIGDESKRVDYLSIASSLIGGGDAQLFSPEDMEVIRTRRDQIAERIKTRDAEIEELLAEPEAPEVEVVPPSEEDEGLDAERIEEIRRSVEGNGTPDSEPELPKRTPDSEPELPKRTPDSEPELPKSAPGQGPGPGFPGQQGMPGGPGPQGQPGTPPPPRGFPRYGMPPQGTQGKDDQR